MKNAIPYSSLTVKTKVSDRHTGIHSEFYFSVITASNVTLLEIVIKMIPNYQIRQTEI